MFCNKTGGFISIDNKYSVLNILSTSAVLLLCCVILDIKTLELRIKKRCLYKGDLIGIKITSMYKICIFCSRQNLYVVVQTLFIYFGQDNIFIFVFWSRQYFFVLIQKISVYFLSRKYLYVFVQTIFACFNSL